MKITFEFNFWLWLMRLSYRKMKGNQPFLPLGIPGLRDPDNPCTGYAPRKRTAGDALPTCQTDGHYLCNECCFREEESKTEQLNGIQVDQVIIDESLERLDKLFIDWLKVLDSGVTSEEMPFVRFVMEHNVKTFKPISPADRRIHFGGYTKAENLITDKEKKTDGE